MRISTALHRCAALGVALALAVTGRADAAPPVLNAGFGPASAQGDGAGRFDHGRAFSLDLTTRAPSGWLARVGQERFDLGATIARAASDGLTLRDFAPLDDGLVATHLSLGVRRGGAWRGVRAHLDGLVGASWTEAHSVIRGARNDRRPDLSEPDVSSSEDALTPSLTLGGGVGVVAPGRVEVSASVATRWSSAPGLAGPLVPIVFGVTWPAPDAAPAAAAPARAPRLRLAGGWSALASPSGLRRSSDADPAVSVGVELPVDDAWSVSLAGGHAIHRDRVRSILRQERDDTGNLVDIYGPDEPRSYSVSIATAGLRHTFGAGALRPSLRAGIGWGRTGGFGWEKQETHGAYLDENGMWVPVIVSTDMAGGVPRSGFAWDAAAGLDVRLRPGLDAFVEVGALGLNLTGDDVTEIPARLGVALR